MNNMIKSTVAGALVAAGVAMTAPANAGQYVNAQLGVSEIGSYSTAYGSYSWDNGLALIGTYGIELPSVHKYFAVEGEISKSIVNPESNNYWGGLGSHAEYDYWTAGGYAVFSIPVHERINIRARAGLVYNNWDITTNYCPATLGCFSYSGSDINPSVSGGATFKFNENINFMAELTSFDINDGNFHLSAGAQFRF